MSSRAFRFMSLVVALFCAVALPAAQTAAAPKGASEGSPSRWDIFAGYSYLAPHGTVDTPVPGGVAVANYDAVNLGGLFSGAYYFNRIVGAQVEFGEHQWGAQKGNSNIGTEGNDDGFVTIGAGLIFRFPAGNITPFV